MSSNFVLADVLVDCLTKEFNAKQGATTKATINAQKTRKDVDFPAASDKRIQCKTRSNGISSKEAHKNKR